MTRNIKARTLWDSRTPIHRTGALWSIKNFWTEINSSSFYNSSYSSSLFRFIAYSVKN